MLLCLCTVRAEMLYVHLPREMTVDSDVVTLGEIGVIKGEENVTAPAGTVSLARLAGPSEEIVIDRNTVLSRLADNDIPKSMVTFTGADQVVVTRKHNTVSTEKIVSEAKKYLEEQVMNESVYKVELRREPDEFVMKNTGGKITLTPKLLPSGSKSYAKVRVYAFSQDKQIGYRDVFFDLKYMCRVAIAKEDMQIGDMLSSDNVTIKNSISNVPEEPGWQVPYGYSAKRTIKAGTEILKNMIEELESTVVIERNQTVLITVNKPGLQITARGKALEKGRKGDFIKVRNVDSQIIIIVEVNDDGTVKPII